MPNEPRNPRDPYGSQGQEALGAPGEGVGGVGGGRRRRGHREPGEQRYSHTPFARVLTAFMWSKTPPWSVSKTAAVLGVNRTRVNNWLYYDIVPETDAMIAVLAKLGIPMSRLLDAYAEMGRPVPPLTEEEARLMSRESDQSSAASGRAGEALQPHRTVQPRVEDITVPNARGGRAGAGRAAERGAPPSPSALSSAPTAVPLTSDASGASGDEWETMVSHTRQVMGATGMPEALIDGMLAHIARIRSGAPSEAERRAAEEFAEQPSKASSADAFADAPADVPADASSGAPSVDKRQTRRSSRGSTRGPIESEAR